MRIVLTGANGQLGRCIQDVWQTNTTPHELITLDRSQLDLSKTDSIVPILTSLKPDIIINAAAYTAVDLAEDEPNLAYLINTAAVEKIAEACSETDAGLIHISTDYVFDGKNSVPYSSNSVINPQSVYGHTKSEGEVFVNKLEKHLIIRTAWVYSEYGNNFLKTMIRLATQHKQLKVVNDQIGCPTDALSLAKAIASCCSTFFIEDAQYGTYHFTGSEQSSWACFAKTIFTNAQLSGVIQNQPVVEQIPSSEFPTKAIRPAYSVLDYNNFITDWNVSTHSLSHGVIRVLNAIKKSKEVL